jgi:hypothetical protein
VAISLIRLRILTLSAAALLLAQGVHGLVECWLESDWGPTLFCIAAIIAGFGLAYRVWWSRPIVAALVFLLLIPSIRTGWHVANSGLFHNRGAFEIFLMILPGLAYLGLSAFCAYVAFRYVPVRSRSKQT